MAKSKTSFKKGEKAAEKWTIKSISPHIEKVYQILTSSDDADNTNPVRANDIKYLEEAVLCAGINIGSWYYWLGLFDSGKFSKEEPIFKLIKSMKKICELRLSYSGATMDIFHLKNHYDYRDATQQEVTVRKLGKDLADEIYE
jgi:hypothetical protein